MQANPGVSFVEAIKLFFSNYTNFSGRSRRSEYWYFALFNVAVTVVLSMLPQSLSMIGGLWSLATLIPGLALAFRRLHDIGKSGWWLLIPAIPVIGSIWLIVLEATDSQPGSNAWGVSPKFSNAASETVNF